VDESETLQEATIEVEDVGVESNIPEINEKVKNKISAYVIKTKCFST
jgi:hypothetical protein